MRTFHVLSPAVGLLWTLSACVSATPVVAPPHSRMVTCFAHIRLAYAEEKLIAARQLALLNCGHNPDPVRTLDVLCNSEASVTWPKLDRESRNRIHEIGMAIRSL